MRQLLFFPCLFAVSFLFAQSKAPGNAVYQNAPPVVKPAQTDCYVRRLDAGTSAFRRGDYRAALRLFEEAKTCPEALSSSRRLKELEARIELCNAQLGRSIVAESQKANFTRSTEKIETTGRKFNMSAAFARNTDPNCFQMTVREADRAFRDSCWDDAAKLYRAAKNCADANQTDRERMSNRIEACRAATEDELLQKEQKAVRTARHALATNSAGEAMRLLKEGDRSLAWRLADFANFYIAPDDNPECLKAMYAAYLYEVQTDDKYSVRPPFCYQLSEDLGSNVQFKFSKNSAGQRLTAFIPAESRAITWELPSMKIIESFSTEILKNPVGFDIAPDGAFLFYGYNYFYLPNGQTVEVPRVTNYCFSEDGDTFFYENIADSTIHSVNLNQSGRAQQQRKGTANLPRINTRAVPIPVTGNLLSMRQYKGEFWLGYTNRIEVLAHDKTTGAMQPRMTWVLGDSAVANAGSFAVYLFPSSREAIVSTPNDFYYYFLHLPPEDSTRQVVMASEKMEGQLMTCSAGCEPLLTVSSKYYPDWWGEVMTVHSLADRSTVANRFIANGGVSSTLFAAISQDGHWIVGHDANGRTRLWSLRDTCVNPPMTFEFSYGDEMSPDGNRLFATYQDKLSIYDTDDLGSGAEQDFQTLPDALLPAGASNKWAVFVNHDSKLALQNLTGKQVYKFDADDIATRRIPYAFDSTEMRYFAYCSGNGLVVVKSLADGSTRASRNFGGEVTILRSIPGSDKLLVVTRFNDINGERYTVKVWDFSKPNENPKVLRLQDYRVEQARVSDQGSRIALSNSTDIRLFLLDNPDNEAVVIKRSKNVFINDIAFRPDGLAIVSGDADGNIDIWDATTGQSLLHFTSAWDGQRYQINHLAFAYGGSRLRIISPGRVFTVDLDAYSLRDLIQSGDRWLTSFTSEQIQAFNLEIAFKYPGNFDRLADSGDFPLIRSFFQYFRDQSISSNNIDQVRNYCERAFTLYELLDAGGQGNLASTMVEMYEDYILKQLLRNNPEEASRVVMHLEKRFDRPSGAVLAAAHSSLVRHDLKAASRLYNDYLLRLSADPSFPYRLNDINTKLTQFQEYDLLDSTQINCLCEVFQQFNSFEKLCPPAKKYTPPSYSAEIPVYRSIYQAIDSVAYWNNRSGKVQVLEAAFARAKNLEYPNPALEHHPLDTLVIVLASAYLDLLSLEQNTPRTPVFCQKAVEMLENAVRYKSGYDTAQFARLAQLQLAWGNYWLENDKPGEAILHYNSGLQAAKKLSVGLGYETMREQQADLLYMAPLYAALCKAKLLDGKPVEARKAHEEANKLFSDKLSPLWLGLAALLDNNEPEALIEFGGMSTAQELGEALYYLNRMAELMPAQRQRLLAFAPRLKTGFLSLHSSITLPELGYWISTHEISRFAAQARWDSTAYWSATALKNLKVVMAHPESATLYRDNWLGLCIGHSFYLLNAGFRDTNALAEVIRYSHDAQIWIETYEPDSYYGPFVLTNMAHAYWLRNQPGDREKALELYKAHLNIYSPYYDTWELLLKDFKDLHRSGVKWPDLKILIQTLFPDGINLTADDWREMGE